MLVVVDLMVLYVGFVSLFFVVDDYGGDLIYLMFDVIFGSLKFSLV